MARLRDSILTGFFLLATALPCALFLARIALHAACPGSCALLLRGGASEIGGLPSAPSAPSPKALLDWHLGQNNPGKVAALEAAARLRQAFAWNIPRLYGPNAEKCYRASAGMLSRAFFRPPLVNRQNARSIASTLARLPLPPSRILYVVPPRRIPPSDRRNFGVFDDKDTFQDLLRRTLEDGGFQVLDLRSDPAFAGKTPRDIFFPTDHHMRGRAGIWAAQAEAAALRSRLGLPVDPGLLADENFSCEIFPACCLGSLGRALSRIPCPPDDFDLVSYARPLDLGLHRISIYMNTSRRSGDASILLSRQYLHAPLYRSNHYDAFLGGNAPYLEILNRSCTNGVSILCLGDSFDNCVVPQLAPAVSRLVSIDPRHCAKLFTGTPDPDFPPALSLPFLQYVAGEHFDAVVVLMNETNLATPLAKLVAKARPPA